MDFYKFLYFEKIKLQYDCPEPFVIKVSPQILIQTFNNLIDNSIYWLNRRKAVEPNFEPVIRILCNLSNGVVSFEDNGYGISPIAADKIFESFYTERVSENGERGRGLGLFIVRTVLDESNIFISLDKSSFNSFGNLYRFNIDFASKIADKE